MDRWFMLISYYGAVSILHFNGSMVHARGFMTWSFVFLIIAFDLIGLCCLVQVALSFPKNNCKVELVAFLINYKDSHSKRL